MVPALFPPGARGAGHCRNWERSMQPEGHLELPLLPEPRRGRFCPSAAQLRAPVSVPDGALSPTDPGAKPAIESLVATMRGFSASPESVRWSEKPERVFSYQMIAPRFFSLQSS